ncbi:hypothetical protein [Bacillus sp. FSL R9-9481]|uniref:hypothetical protein n=1 Tax=Bacillus sp. FSL R9-9481 TaxID=2921591 RepID=UPI0030F6D711
MKLSEALKNRDVLKKKAEDIEKWFLHQKFTEKSAPWLEVRVAIDKVLNELWEKHNELDEKIEKVIVNIEI